MVNPALPPHVVEMISRRLAEPIDMDKAIAAATPHWSNGRRPDFWADAEVTRALTLLHRRVTIAVATAAIRARYGAERAPGKSAIGRYWLVLDRAFGRKAA